MSKLIALYLLVAFASCSVGSAITLLYKLAVA